MLSRRLFIYCLVKCSVITPFYSFIRFPNQRDARICDQGALVRRCLVLRGSREGFIEMDRRQLRNAEKPEILLRSMRKGRQENLGKKNKFKGKGVGEKRMVRGREKEGCR